LCLFTWNWITCQRIVLMKVHEQIFAWPVSFSITVSPFTKRSLKIVFILWRSSSFDTHLNFKYVHGFIDGTSYVLTSYWLYEYSPSQIVIHRCTQALSADRSNDRIRRNCSVRTYLFIETLFFPSFRIHACAKLQFYTYVSIHHYY
jgi:hypothetical protein